MRLNPDCIRAILLAVEDATDSDNGFYYSVHLEKDDFDAPSLLDAYTDNEIRYHINQCDLSGFFSDCEQFVGGGCLISDLSPLGHEFLSDIREDGNWEKVKTVSTEVGSRSLKAMTQIASAVVTELIKNKLGLP